MRFTKNVAMSAAKIIPEGVTQEEMQNYLYDREESEDRSAGDRNTRVPGVLEVFRRMKRWMEK